MSCATAKKKIARIFSCIQLSTASLHSRSNIDNVVPPSRRPLHRLVKTGSNSLLLAGFNFRPARSVGPLVRPGHTANSVRPPPTRPSSPPRPLSCLGRQPPCRQTMAAATKPRVVLLDIGMAHPVLGAGWPFIHRLPAELANTHLLRSQRAPSVPSHSSRMFL